jgi:hypothetical protein
MGARLRTATSDSVSQRQPRTPSGANGSMRSMYGVEAEVIT